MSLPVVSWISWPRMILENNPKECDYISLAPLPNFKVTYNWLLKLLCSSSIPPQLLNSSAPQLHLLIFAPQFLDYCSCAPPQLHLLILLPNSLLTTPVLLLKLLLYSYQQWPPQPRTTQPSEPWFTKNLSFLYSLNSAPYAQQIVRVVNKPRP